MDHLSKLQPVRGMHDLLPDDARKFRVVVERARVIAEQYGFTEIMTPVVEFSEVFERTLGDSSDVVSKETYSFTDRGGESITLRPEFTAGIARAFISNQLKDHLPLKYFYAGAAFRYERPQKGRQRQFHQLGVELLGVPTPQADIEVIALAHQMLCAFGLKDVTLELNTLGDAQSRANYRAALVQYFTAQRDKLSDDSKLRLERNPLRILDSKDEGDKKINAEAPQGEAYLSPAAATFFANVKEGLEALSIPFTINSRLVRGLDYYSHTVFEFTSTALGAQNTILAGGRYDQLIATMGGPETPGIGWAAGIERLLTTIDFSLPQNAVRPPRPVVVVPMGEAAEKHALVLATDLRRAGLYIELGYSGNVGKRMKRADKLGAKYALILGEDELKRSAVALRDLATGEQKEVPLSNLITLLK